MAKDWSPNQWKFMDWLATPEMDRAPYSQRALAKEMGIHEVTLSKWKADPDFTTEVKRLKKERLGTHYTEAVDALIREMRKGSFQHLKLFFEMIGEYVQRQEVTGKDGGPVSHDISVRAIDYRVAITPLAPGPVGDSDAPGEN